MFDGKYLDWNNKRIKGIVDFYGHKFFFYKKIADLGCGHADISGVLYRLGADITAVDARPEHLKIVTKKFPGIKTVKADLDRGWPFSTKFDLVLDLDIICHLSSFEDHLKMICANTSHLIIETAVCDSDDPNKVIVVKENKSIYDLSVNGLSCRPSAAAIERVLHECGMNFKRLDQERFNSGSYVYNWEPKNNDDCNVNKRRMWFAIRNDSPIKFANTKQTAVISPSINNKQSLILQNSKMPVVSPFANNETIVNNPNTSVTVQSANDAPYNQDIPGKKKFVIVIPSYNNQNWANQNIMSTINQNYDQYRVIFTDDCSSDSTFSIVSNTVNTSEKANKFTLIKNTTRLGALANLYNMIHSCADDEIILTLDGDDWFPHENVLNKLNEVYSSEDIWMTYGQYQNHPDGGSGIAQPYPDHIIESNSFRYHVWSASHLRTFYTWLFKKIKKEDLFYNGDFFPMTWDFAIMFPMLEMAGRHSRFISDILYMYNLSNPINDHKVNVRLQQDLDRHVRGLSRYSRCEKPIPPPPPPPKKTTVGLLLIATGKYHSFVQGLVSSADNFFLNDCKVTYYIFSDTNQPISSSRGIVNIPITHRPFPFASMDRFKHFNDNAEKINQEDYLYYIDVDTLFVDHVSKDILGKLVGVRHCGYINSRGPYETNPQSVFYTNNERYKNYYGGGFSGGKTEEYLKLSKWCDEMIQKDLSSNITPVWHDETALNRYFLDNEPEIILDPGYHFPQSNIDHYKRAWQPHNFSAKILLLDKNHQEIRK